MEKQEWKQGDQFIVVQAGYAGGMVYGAGKKMEENGQIPDIFWR